jgi:hypothetical protein
MVSVAVSVSAKIIIFQEKSPCPSPSIAAGLMITVSVTALPGVTVIAFGVLLLLAAG